MSTPAGRYGALPPIAGYSLPTIARTRYAGYSGKLVWETFVAFSPTLSRVLRFAFLAAMLHWSEADALTVREYTNIRDSADLARYRDLKIYISGLAAGYAWTNTALIAEKVDPLFCLPPNMPISVDWTPLIDNEIGKPETRRDDFIELLLLSALRNKFPCVKVPALDSN